MTPQEALELIHEPGSHRMVEIIVRLSRGQERPYMHWRSRDALIHWGFMEAPTPERRSFRLTELGERVAEAHELVSAQLGSDSWDWGWIHWNRAITELEEAKPKQPALHLVDSAHDQAHGDDGSTA